MARFAFARIHALVRRSSRRGERGQVMMMAVLLLPILLGMTGMAIDIGTYADHRRTLQNAADAAAMAGARDLPSSSAATASALAWGANNGIAAADMTIVVTPQSATNPNPRIHVTIEEGHTFHFMNVLGISNKNVGAKAAAIKTTPGGAGAVVPWAITEDVWTSAGVGESVVLKYDATNVSNGNFGAIRIDGNGSAVYEDSIIGGSDAYICAESVPSCVDTSPVCDSVSVCPTETGNKVGPTRDGVDWRIDNTDAQCDTFGEAFSGPVSGKYMLEPDCNPWTTGGYESHRVIIVPIVDALCNGSCDVTVINFGMFFLEGYNSGKCTGNTCEITGRFVNADANINALTGIFDEDAALQFTKLDE